MLFNSIEFVFFLPIVFILYWFVCDRWIASSNYQLKVQNAFVVVASYVFYGWWDWRFLLLIAFTTLCSYISGRLMADKKWCSWSKFVLWTNILLNLSILALFKYYDFFASEFIKAFGLKDDILLHLILPVGISFYTFQALSYSIDVYKKKLEPTRDMVEFFAYVSFFPQLVAGPIERATNLLPQFQCRRTFDYMQAVDGMRQILWGLFKKVVVADNCALYVDDVWADYANYSGSTLLFAAVLFSIQIYCDFSGYSDIAIGTAKLFGIRLMQNFRTPYFSRNIAEFWRRWHISLTTWFRDYVYIPLGGSRCSKRKVVRNTFVIFLLSGFWHGANWTFILWGFYHAMLFLPLILMKKNRKFTDVVAGNRMLPNCRELLQMMITFFLAVMGWIIFRAPDISVCWEYMQGIFTQGLFTMPLGRAYVWCFPIFFNLLLLLVAEWFGRKNEHGLSWLAGRNKALQIAVYYMLALLILYNMGESETFIYFQF